MHPIAVLCRDIPEGINWARCKFGDEITQIRYQHRRILLKDNTELVLICNYEQIQGMKFSGLEKTTEYSSLESEIRNRIRL